MPFLGFKDCYEGTTVVQGLFNGSMGDAMLEEYQGLEVYAPMVYAQPTLWHFTEKEVKELAGMEGIKLLAIGREAAWMRTMGATPVTVAYPDIYVSLDKGLIDCDFVGMGSVMGLGTMELYQYALAMPGIISGAYGCALINPDSWAGLPPDVQKVIKDLEPWYTEEFLALEVETDMAGRAMMQDMGIVINEVSAEEMENDWKPIFTPEHDSWIASVEEKGKPGQALYDEIQRLISEL
jgi:TRAP-type C4-dicarboxylate transport system substrate-binding protein